MTDPQTPDAAPADGRAVRSPTSPVTVGVLGATGLVGREMIRLLEVRGVPVTRLLPLASHRSTTTTLGFRGEMVRVEEATPDALASVDLVLSSAGGEVSRRLLPGAAASGAICIDNTSAFRMDPAVPLVVPEVNGHRLSGLRVGGPGAIVANPNCSTIQLVMALEPLHRLATVRRAIVSTYQSISGAGRRAVAAFEEASRALLDETRADTEGTVAFDVRPEIGGLDDAGDSIEELKMVRETPKILEADLELDVTCVRVPVFRGHAESVWIETAEPVSPEAAREALAAAPGVSVADPEDIVTPRGVQGGDLVHVARLRGSRTSSHGLQLWVVADNLLKGAALNAVQIAERILASSGTAEAGGGTAVGEAQEWAAPA